MPKTYFYKRVREGIPTFYQTSALPLDDPGLTEMTEEDYNAEVAVIMANQPEPTDDATEGDFLEALTDLGVIP